MTICNTVFIWQYLILFLYNFTNWQFSGLRKALTEAYWLVESASWFVEAMNIQNIWCKWNGETRLESNDWFLTMKHFGFGLSEPIVCTCIHFHESKFLYKVDESFRLLILKHELLRTVMFMLRVVILRLLLCIVWKYIELSEMRL